MDASLSIDLAWLLRTGRAREGAIVRGCVSWDRGGEPAGSISYTAYMDEPGSERLVLSYERGPDHAYETVTQTVRLCHTVPNYGGKRWWLVCPYRGCRIGKLYLPPGGDRFASRLAYQLAYQSQREKEEMKPFSRLFRLQEKLGCPAGWEVPILRPKGMWQRTFDRYLERYRELDVQCAQRALPLIEQIDGERWSGNRH